jgi:hypothetical protein
LKVFATADDAAYHFARAFQETTACISDVPFNYPIAKPLDTIQSIVLGRGADVPVGDEGLSLFVGHYYTVVEVEVEDDGEIERGFAVRTGGYTYKVESHAEGGELFCWHWHPEGTSWCRWPHLHARTPRHGDHLPTSRVALEQVVRWLIVEADVPWLRPDWDEILDRNEADWRDRRNWA